MTLIGCVQQDALKSNTENKVLYIEETLFILYNNFKICRENLKSRKKEKEIKCFLVEHGSGDSLMGHDREKCDGTGKYKPDNRKCG